MTSTISTLNALHIFEALAVLQQIENLPVQIDPYELGKLRAKAGVAAIQLRVHSGLQDVRIAVKEAAE